MQNAAKTYFQTQVTTTNQGDILILLFDGAIKYLTQAREKIVEKNYAQKGILISKVMDIMTELQSSLNAQKGGELAGNLQRLYFYCNTQLLKANIKMDVGIIDEVLHIISGLRDAFSQANAQFDAKAQAAQAAMPKPPIPQAPRVSTEAASGDKPKPALNVYAIPKRQPVPAAPAQPAPVQAQTPRPAPSGVAASSAAEQKPVASETVATIIPPAARTVKKAFAAYAGAQKPKP
jgi:flagellar secretion chaperone FliS